ncbi:serine/threonine-protein phosphatase 6 regulatory subunit 2 isoform X1 [Monodelphis domestica]|uniref:serine/threonine-protein phosphatase 6 regulatory subunit 2 isoform X1 n=2 Tax=Monodelphis domestica TaxID=13616 RepID=UPI0024E22B1F|nr:serine/threonine-protein phosphatase 6 regulatory subunit 2 isoform X1 [Monodelphis domestica]XP_056653510.1 serine/threonine-protein phosphatase 6 regulatory subunit 2 isoform X1 [Monodelphis domestica]XP_056653511.1 serine/threonine-protein phosphatase 6 regulatory subunit 2 isoform X1 [Monodelphis domestica]XP_056653512.1 serine/threonine-protein phosphatase 6 regulatory subunit 2 isoform X1 [Monodelphis domestica]XP_056653513.1 serine/threonine-protein phosphatase 6 regulatory subunit 2 
MFWKFDLNTTSHVDKLLEKEDVTLHELMDEDDILQECKAQNRKLLDFLCKQQCMEELVSLITHDPPLDMEEKVRFKYPNTACELLTSDVPQINDKLGGDETLLNILYDFLDHEPPLNPLLASFFSKTIGNLIARKTEQVITFLKKKDQFISLVLKHIDTSAMMDLLLRLISCVEPAALRQEVLNWLNEENVIERLVQLIHSSQDEDRQSNASQTLCDIIRLSRDQGSQTQEISEPDPLLTALESQECVEQLLKNMFDGDVTENCLVNGTQILLTLLETRRSGVEGLVDSFSQGFERSYTVNSSILHGIEPWLKDFHQLLLTPPKKMSILTTIGILEEPLGNARLHGARLIAALLHTNTPSINQELCRLNTMDLLLDLFFKFTWNNFLHFQVELCVAAILSHSAREGGMLTKEADSREDLPNGNGSLEKTECAEVTSENVMVTHLFQKCCLVQRILDAWEANDRIQAEGGMRRGNMGHLTRIANAVVQNMEKGPIQTQISSFIKELPEDCRGRWESFVEETLPETNRRNTVDLVSTHHLHSSSEDEDMESAFPNELSLQQAFSEYQIQQMTANFVDQFGFNDEEFADQDDNINAPFDRIAEINFTIDADDDSPNASLFEACCSDRIQPFDDNEEEEDIWEDKEVNYATQAKSRTRFGASHTSEYSPQSNLENGDQDGSEDSEEEDGGDDGPRLPERTSSSNISLQGDLDSSEGSGWTAVFDEPVNSKPPPSGVAMDIGSRVWDAAAAADTCTSEEKGWAKFTDFQSFCCSESGPRCSSPVDTGSSTSEGKSKQGQDKTFSPAAPCVWNVCVARKAPLVASDSSSSGGSDSEDEEEEEEKKAGVVTETVGPGPGQEGLKPTTEAKAEISVITSTEESPGTPKATVSERGVTGAPQQPSLQPLSPATVISAAAATAAVPTAATTAVLSAATTAVLTAVPAAATTVAATTVAATTVAATAALETVMRDRKEEAPPSPEATLNGPA